MATTGGATSSLPLLSRGSSGATVRELQRQLESAGFATGGIDGQFGPKTESAVRAFQRARGLTVDGIVGPQTRRALLSTASTPTAPTASAGPTPPGAAAAARSRTSTIGGVATWKVEGKSGVAFKGGLSVDADGSPHAYHPRNIGLDALGNAGRPGNWWGIATNSSGEPYVQGAKDPAPGYYVSTTALVDGRYGVSDPRRYVDSETIPFIAIPPALKNQGLKLGDLVAVRNERTGKTVFAVIADIGPAGHLGEGSIKLAQALGVNANARSGGASGGISYVAFPNTKQAFPMSYESIQAAGQRVYDAWGGDAQLASAVR